MTNNDNNNSYDWLFIRNGLGQDGSGEQGTSPDIISLTTTATSDQLQGFADHYDKAFTGEIDYQGSNYVYVRLKNVGQESAAGGVSLYYCLASEINDFKSWIRLSTASGDNNVTISADAGEVVVTKTPFLFGNVSAPIEGAPYVLVAFVTDEDHPRPKSTLVKSMQKAIESAGNAGYLTLEVPPPPPSPPTGFSWSSNVDLKNTDPTDVTIQLMSSSFDEGAQAYFLFEAHDANDNVISIGKSSLVKGQVFGTQAELPANYASKVTIAYFANAGDNNKLSASFTLQILKPGMQKTELLEEFEISISQTAQVASSD